MLKDVIEYFKISLMMKKLIVTFFILTNSSFLFAQIDYAYLGFGSNGYKNDQYITYFTDSFPGNVWVVKIPDGIVFNEAFLSEYALLTDKNLMIADSSWSAFYLIHKVDTYAFTDPRPILIAWTFLFEYMADLSANDSVSFTMSFDNGITFYNPFEHDFGPFWGSNYYPSGPLVMEFPVANNDHKWIQVHFDLEQYLQYLGIYTMPQMIIFKIAFKSDKKSNTEGIMFDDFLLYYDYLGIEKSNSKNSLTILINGKVDAVKLNDVPENYFYQIYDLKGREVKNNTKINSKILNISNVTKTKGIYILSLIHKNGKEKIIKKYIFN